TSPKSSSRCSATSASGMPPIRHQNSRCCTGRPAVIAASPALKVVRIQLPVQAEQADAESSGAASAARSLVPEPDREVRLSLHGGVASLSELHVLYFSILFTGQLRSARRDGRNERGAPGGHRGDQAAEGPLLPADGHQELGRVRRRLHP